MELFGREWRNGSIMFLASHRQRIMRSIEQHADRIGSRLRLMRDRNSIHGSWRGSVDLELHRQWRRLQLELHRTDTTAATIIRRRVSRSLIAHGGDVGGTQMAVP